MITIRQDTLVRVTGSYAGKYGFWTRLAYDLTVDDEQWDPETSTLYNVELDEIKQSEMELYRVHINREVILINRDDIDILTAILGSDIDESRVRFTHMSYNTTIVQVLEDPFVEGNMNSIVLYGDTLYPAVTRDGIEIMQPASIPIGLEPEYNREPYIMFTDTGIFVTYIDDRVRDILIYLYDYGYKFHYNMFSTSIPYRTLYSYYNDPEFLYRFLLYLDNVTADMINIMADVKKEANDLLYVDGDPDILHRMVHTGIPNMSWFFYPDGYYHYGYDSGHDWMLKMKEIKLQYYPELTKVLLKMVSTVPRVLDKGVLGSHLFADRLVTGGNLEHDTKIYHTYDIDDKIRDALQEVNSDGIKVVLAGGFTVTKGDYDFFILGGDINVGKRLMERLGSIRMKVRGAVATDEENKYQYVFGTDMRSILNVLYSFDMSHTMIAYDGYQYHVTPEYATFTPAGLSLMVLPVVKGRRLEKVIDAGLAVVYNHVNYYIIPDNEHIDEYIESYVDHVQNHLQSRKIGYIHFVYDAMNPHDRRTHGRVLGIEHSMFNSSIYMDRNGINIGYKPPIPEQLYYMEDYNIDREPSEFPNKSVLREISELSPLA